MNQIWQIGTEIWLWTDKKCGRTEWTDDAKTISLRLLIGFQDQLSLNSGQKYCRILQGEHSAILSNFIKLPFVIKFFVLFIFSSPEPKAHGWANSIPVTPASVRRLSSVRPSVHNFKHLLLWNHWANQTQISYGDSLGRGNESLFKWSWSHDQDGRHDHIW